MILTTLLLTLKFMTVYVEPKDPFAKDDQTLATCAVHALTARPSALTIAMSKETADVTLVVGSHTAKKLHVVGKLVKKDGTVLVAETDHSTMDVSRLCEHLGELLTDMAKKLKDGKLVEVRR
jgi:hypothetical protein